jgi:ankyrin repeat protein
LLQRVFHDAGWQVLWNDFTETSLQIANDNRLRAACTKGNVEEVTQLLKLGADASTVDVAGNTPLHLVCQGTNARENGCELAMLLLSCGANVDALSNNGFSPLHVAAFSNNHSLCNLLIEN